MERRARFLGLELLVDRIQHEGVRGRLLSLGAPGDALFHRLGYAERYWHGSPLYYK
jgi:hypothetical protein